MCLSTGEKRKAVMKIFLCLCLIVVVVVAHDDQRYDVRESIPLFVDNVIPEDNPSELYRYYSLPYCQPETEKRKSPTFGEELQGSHKIYSPYNLPFNTSFTDETLCTKELSASDVAVFRNAIMSGYHYTMFYDEILLRGFVGTIDTKGDVLLYTHLNFHFAFNRDRVIEADVLPEKSKGVRLVESTAMKITFTYSASWTATEVSFEDRTANNEAEHDAEHVEVQWFGIVNSMVIVVSITVFLVIVVLRLLNRDYQRYSVLEEENDVEESGWKRLHADVFRFPKYRALFSSIVGCGVQIMLIFVCMLTLAVVGVFYPHGRGTMYATMIFIYALTALIGGFISGSLYRQIGGTSWVHNVLLTVSLFAGPLFVIWSLLNTIAIFYGSTAALRFWAIEAIFATYFLAAFPLTLCGALIGKNLSSDFDAPTRTKFAPREIPHTSWLYGTATHILIGGGLPFIAIYLELYYVFVSIWGHQNFAPFGILYLLFLMLISVTSCMTAMLTYLRLNNENHQWWWMSILTGGSSAGFVFLYSLHFLMAESRMSGLMQLSFYFGYTAVMCYALFLMLGSVGFLASVTLVKQMYRRIKCD